MSTAQQDLDGGDVTTTGYIHGDLMGTTRAVSGAYAEVIRRNVYTAFGELITNRRTVIVQYDASCTVTLA